MVRHHGSELLRVRRRSRSSIEPAQRVPSGGRLLGLATRAALPFCVLCVLGTAAARGAEREAVASLSSTEGSTSSVERLVYRETPNDPYVPVPESKRVTSPALPVVLGPHVSVQVNVDADGNNIVGDAANEPSIAVDPIDPTRMAIGWRQFDTTESDFRQAGYGFTTDGGSSWTSPGVLQPGVFGSDPVLDSDAEGTFLYESLNVDYEAGDYTCHVFSSIDWGGTWGPPVYAHGGDKPWMSVDRTRGTGHGNVYMTWRGEDQFTRSVDGVQSFETPIQIRREPGFGGTTVGPDGALYVAGWSDSLDTFVVARSSSMQDPAAPMAFDFALPVDLGGELIIGYGPNPGGLLGQVWVATDHSNGPTRGNVYLACSTSPLDAFDQPARCVPD